MVREMDEYDFDEEVLDYIGPVVVEFFATWCPHCKEFAPVLDEVSNELSQVKFLKLDIDKNPKLVHEYAIKNIPTLILFKNGMVTNTMSGGLPKDELREYLQSYLEY